MSTITDLPAGRHALLGSPELPATVQCGACGRTAARSSMTFDGDQYLCGAEALEPPELRAAYLSDIAACYARQKEARRAAREAEKAAEPMPVQCGGCDYEGTGESREDRETDVRAHLAAEHGPDAAEEMPEPACESGQDEAEPLEPLPATPDDEAAAAEGDDSPAAEAESDGE